MAYGKLYRESGPNKVVNSYMIPYSVPLCRSILPDCHLTFFGAAGFNFVGARTIGCSIQSFFFLRSVIEYPEFLTGIFGRTESALVVFGPRIE